MYPKNTNLDKILDAIRNGLMQNSLKRMQINNEVPVKGVCTVPCTKLELITEENIEIFLLNQDNVSLWMHISTIAIPQEDISIMISIRI